MNGQSSESANYSLPMLSATFFMLTSTTEKHETQRRSIKAGRNRHLMSPSTANRSPVASSSPRAEAGTDHGG